MNKLINKHMGEINFPAYPFKMQQDLRGIPQWLLREYIERAGGAMIETNHYRGNEWEALLEVLPDDRLGNLRLEQIRIIWMGSEQAFWNVWKQLEKMLIRAGG